MGEIIHHIRTRSRHLSKLVAGCPAWPYDSGRSVGLSMRPFWRMLVAIDSGRSPHLSCDESFAILEFLADEALNGADPQMLHNAIRRHLARCPDCWSYYLERLKVMESELAARSQHGQIS